MSTTFFNSLNSDASAFFTYSVASTTVTYPGSGILLDTGGAGLYNQGLMLTVPIIGRPGSYFEWSMLKNNSNGNCYAFAGAKKTSTISELDNFGAYFSTVDLFEAILTATVLANPVVLDQWYKIKMEVKADNTWDLYLDDVFVENTDPATTLRGVPLYLQLAAPFYSPKVGYKDVTIFTPGGDDDEAEMSDQVVNHFLNKLRR